MRCVLILLSGILATLWSTTALADDAYKFVAEYVRELAAIEDIRATAEKELANKQDNVLAGCIRSSTRFQLELQSSITIMKALRLDAPANDLIANISSFYETKIGLYQQLGATCGALIAGPKPGVDYGQLAADAPKINAQLEYADHALFNAIPLVFATLIDRKPDAENHLSGIVFTRAQKDTLVRELNSRFGRKMDAQDQNWAVSAASVLKSYLTTKGYKCTDER
jgi:hypothetical protein